MVIQAIKKIHTLDLRGKKFAELQSRVTGRSFDSHLRWGANTNNEQFPVVNFESDNQEWCGMVLMGGPSENPHTMAATNPRSKNTFTSYANTKKPDQYICRPNSTIVLHSTSGNEDVNWNQLGRKRLGFVIHTARPSMALSSNIHIRDNAIAENGKHNDICTQTNHSHCNVEKHGCMFQGIQFKV